MLGKYQTTTDFVTALVDVVQRREQYVTPSCHHCLFRADIDDILLGRLPQPSRRREVAVDPQERACRANPGEAGGARQAQEGAWPQVCRRGEDRYTFASHRTPMFWYRHCCVLVRSQHHTLCGSCMPTDPSRLLGCAFSMSTKRQGAFCVILRQQALFHVFLYFSMR